MAEGLTCLIKVGAEADQNYQNYILRGIYIFEIQYIRALFKIFMTYNFISLLE